MYARKTPHKRELLFKGKRIYRPPLPSAYKEMELPEDLNDGMEWVFE